ncbi:hypothetical protein [Endozoicomonas sp. 2B-B]
MFGCFLLWKSFFPVTARGKPSGSVPVQAFALLMVNTGSRSDISRFFIEH